jgi:hypothetical protein
LIFLGKYLSWEKIGFVGKNSVFCVEKIRFFGNKSDVFSNDRFFWEGFGRIPKISAKTKNKKNNIH